MNFCKMMRPAFGDRPLFVKLICDTFYASFDQNGQKSGFVTQSADEDSDLPPGHRLVRTMDRSGNSIVLPKGQQ